MSHDTMAFILETLKDHSDRLHRLEIEAIYNKQVVLMMVHHAVLHLAAGKSDNLQDYNDNISKSLELLRELQKFSDPDRKLGERPWPETETSEPEKVDHDVE